MNSFHIKAQKKIYLAIKTKGQFKVIVRTFLSKILKNFHEILYSSILPYSTVPKKIKVILTSLFEQLWYNSITLCHKLQGDRFTGSREEDFKRLLLSTGMPVILSSDSDHLDKFLLPQPQKALQLA